MMAEGIVRRRVLLVAAGWMAFTVPVLGQSVKTPAYDVVAIKINKSGTNMTRVTGAGDRYSATNVSLRLLIEEAYDLKTDNLISGLPGWVNSTRVDIEAKMDADAAAALLKLPKEEQWAQRRLMMQSLLAERFQLKIHHESKELPMYSLVIAKGGFKLKDADPNNTYPNGIKGLDGMSHPGMMMIRNGQMTAQAITISNLASSLSRMEHREVIDKTGLTGKYDISLRWTPDDDQATAMPGEKQDAEAAAANSGPSIFTALQEQLGLRLEPIKGPVDTIVVDHIEMPSDN